MTVWGQALLGSEALKFGQVGTSSRWGGDLQKEPLLMKTNERVLLVSFATFAAPMQVNSLPDLNWQSTCSQDMCHIYPCHF